MFHVANTLTVKGLTFTRNATDLSDDGTMYTDYSVTRNSRYAFDPEIARITLYAGGTVLAFSGAFGPERANHSALLRLAEAIKESDLTVSPISSFIFN